MNEEFEIRPVDAPDIDTEVQDAEGGDNVEAE